ncbi:MAG: hypothetical protein OEM82_11925 [Acidobacteriota bacterium]|nr:hypothetical protein [Acidobacteriota bacterium]MDH3530531.1 hypothetical protein [Acidobacteriota bacterium]
MIHRFIFLTIAALLTGSLFAVSGQVDSVVGQVTTTTGNSFAGGISSDGRLIVFESNGNIASVNPRNEDRNNEIFIFDYAQRRIFQITDTKAALIDLDDPFFPSNTFVDVTNARPVMSADGRWIAFGSNAATTFGKPADGTNPGNFDANDLSTHDPGDPNNPDDDTVENPMTADGNLEIWLYMVPAVAPANLSSGDELPVTDLAAGTFIQVTNTPASIPPVSGGPTQTPIIASDNRIPSISDDGNMTAFVSNRNLVGTGNEVPEDNPEIFVYVRNPVPLTGTSLISQVTQTPRGAISAPITNSVPTIAGDGSRLMFSSNGQNPIVGMTGGDNSDENREVFFSDLDGNGAPTGMKKQITVTTPTNPGGTVNAVGFGRRMSRNGNLIVFDSYADLANEHSGENQAAFGTFLYDVAADTFRRIGARSDDDPDASGGDIERLPGFTDYVAGEPQSLILETRMNIAPDGNVPDDPENGLNNDFNRPAQLYTYPLNVPAATATFTRITKLPSPRFQLGTILAIPSDSSKRVAINLPGSEIGTGNFDFSSEVYYVLQPDAVREASSSFSYSTGASRIPIQNAPLPGNETIAKAGFKKQRVKPKLGATPTPTPTPTPATPAAKQGLSPGMLAFLDYTTGLDQPTVARIAVGDVKRSFPLPIELSGVTMTINGAAVGLKRVGRRQIEFVVPNGLAQNIEAPYYPVVINNNGTIIRGSLAIVTLQPDLFISELNPNANRARMFNVTNAVHTREPFDVTTIRRRGHRRVPTVLRLFATGIRNAPAENTAVRIGPELSGLIVNGPIESEPGVYYFDFELTPEMEMLGDQPVLISILLQSGGFTSRLQADAPRVRIL